MYSKELLQLGDLQPFIDRPDLINQTLEFQLNVANYLQTPRQLLKILANNSPYPQVVEAAKLHVNLAGEVGENWREVAEIAIKNAPLEQNDRLVAELLKIAPVPEYLISEWIPGHRLIEGLENPYLPHSDKIKLLERLADSTIIEERLKAAAHPDTPREILEILAGDLELPIRIAVKYRDDDFDDLIEVIESQHEVASNWDTNPQQLVELAQSKWSWIRQAVARNFNAPVEVLGKLAEDGEEKIQLAIARNLAAPGEVLDLLVNHGWGEVTESIAKHPNASEDALVKLFARYENLIIERPNLPSGVLAELLNYGEQEEDRYDIFLIQQKNTPASTLAKAIDILEHDPELVYCSEDLATHPNILVSSLEKLSKHENSVIRLAVCENLKTPEALRNQLLEAFLNLQEQQEFQHTEYYKITTEEIWARLAKLETTPGFILEKLSNRIHLLDNPRIYRTIGINIIGNLNTPKHLREELQQKLLQLSENYQNKYPEWDISLALAFNSSIPKNHREEYFQRVIDNSSEGCKYLAESPKTPPHILEQISEIGFKGKIARNPNTPVSILHRLTHEQDRFIRDDATKNPSTTADILAELINLDNPEYRPRREFNLEYRCYEDWSKFWFEYPNVSSLDLYRILLSKELSDENEKSHNFIVAKYFEISQFKIYLANSGDKKYRLSLARRSDTPINILEKLVKDDDVDVRIALAKSDNRPLHILLLLNQDSDIRVRKHSFKYNQETPIEILQVLKNDEAKEIRKSVAGYHKTSAEILIYLSDDSSTEIKQKVANNPNTPVDILEQLWREYKIFSSSNHNTPSHVVAEKIASTNKVKVLYEILKGSLKTDPQIPSNILENLALHEDSVVRSHVAEHPNTPVHSLEVLADDSYSVTRCNLAQNPNTPAHVLEHLLNTWEFCANKSEYELSLLAKNVNSPPEVLEGLADNEYFLIRQEIVRNPSISISAVAKLLVKGEEVNSNILNILINHPTSNHEIVNKLLQSPNPEIRRNVIDIPYVTPEQWIKLALDESSEIRESVARYSNGDFSHPIPSSSIDIGHPNLPLEIWEELAKDSSVEVREALICNLNFPEQIIELLASDESPDVRERLINFTNLPLSLLETLSCDISPNVRKAVAKHPNTSVALLEQLALDNHQEISQEILKNPNIPLNLKCTLQERLRVNKNPTLKGLTRLYKSDDDLPTLLSEYLQSSVHFVRFISLMHPLISIEFLQQYSQSLLWWERYAVAINSSTPLHIRERLTEDCNCVVKAAAK